MLGSLTAGAVGTVLTVAGVLKLARPSTFETTLRRLVPRRVWARARAVHRGPAHAAVAIALAEVLTGIGLLTLGGRAGVALAAAATALTGGFVAAVARARRVGASCACFGGIARGPAGTFESVRAMALLCAAAVTLWQRLIGSTGGPSSATILVGVMVGAVVAGASLRHAGASGPIEVVVRVVGGRTPLFVAPDEVAHAGPAPAIDLAPEEGRAIVGAVRASTLAARAEAWFAAGGTHLEWDRAVVRRPPGRPLAGVVAVAGPASSLVVHVADPADERGFTAMACAPSRGCVALSGRSPDLPCCS